MTDVPAIAEALARADVLADGSPTPSPEDEAAGEDMGDPGEAPPPEDDLDWDLLRLCAAEPQNDIGNSRRLRHRYGEDLIHVQAVDFFAYNGRRWAEDIDGRVSRPICHDVAGKIMLESMVLGPTAEEQMAIEMAKDALAALDDAEKRLAAGVDKAEAAETAAEIRREIAALKDVIAAGRAAQARVSKRRADRRRFGVASGNAGKLQGMLGEALSYLSHPVTDLDRDPMAFNCQNGTLHFIGVEVEDLECPDPDVKRFRTEWRCDLRSHNRADLMSKMAEVEFEPKATAPRFEAFLATILPNPQVRGFVQRFFGYSITALTREQVFCLFHGEGRNGKSTLVDVVGRILADYSTSLPIATLVNDNRTGKGSEATPDLAKLPGARMVRAAEPKEGMTFDESLIKSLTSSEPIPIRRLNKEFIDFYPAFKLVISANRKPTIRGNDDGIWRRVMLVPFEVQIAEEDVDKGLPEKLWEERSGILNWLVAGCLEYLALGGLKPPDEVRAATKEYREESDVVGAFVRAAIVITGSSYDEIEAGVLYAAYVKWCQRAASTPVASTTFNRRMPKAATQFGFTKGKSSVSVYSGIAIRDEYKPDPHATRRHDLGG